MFILLCFHLYGKDKSSSTEKDGDTKDSLWLCLCPMVVPLVKECTLKWGNGGKFNKENIYRCMVRETNKQWCCTPGQATLLALKEQGEGVVSRTQGE